MIERTSVKIILLNDQNKLLLMCANTRINEDYQGRFWFPIGGGINDGENIYEAAYREVFEETGIKNDEITLGPIVWKGEFIGCFFEQKVHHKETFIVGRTKKNEVFLNNLDDFEKKVVLEIKWFSLDEIKNSTEIIFPVLLPKYLPDILLEKYPQNPLEIDLATLPDFSKVK